MTIKNTVIYLKIFQFLLHQVYIRLRLNHDRNKHGIVLKDIRRLTGYQKNVLLTVARHTKTHQQGRPTDWFSFGSSFVSDEES